MHGNGKEYFSFAVFLISFVKSSAFLSVYMFSSMTHWHNGISVKSVNILEMSNDVISEAMVNKGFPDVTAHCTCFVH